MSQGPFRRFSVAAGNFFFKYRNGLFPAVFVLFLLVMRPRIMFGSYLADGLLVRAGVDIALLGECVRLSTIGFEYIERGGKQGKVYASFLVRKGVYGLCRNPMYVGNMMIGTGIVMASGSPLAYMTVIPFFAFVYHAITSAEEEYLRSKFGAAYDEYCRHVPRFIPSLKNFKDAFSGVRLNRKRPFKQDLSTITWVSLVLLALPLWRAYFLYGWDIAKTIAPQTAILEGTALLLYLVLTVLKKRKSLLFYDKEDREPAKTPAQSPV